MGRINIDLTELALAKARMNELQRDWARANAKGGRPGALAGTLGRMAAAGLSARRLLGRALVGAGHALLPNDNGTGMVRAVRRTDGC